MADNVTLPLTGAGDETVLVSAEEVTTLNAGAVTAQKVQRIAPVLITANGTAVDLPGDGTNGAKVQLPAATVAALASAANQATGNTSLASIVTALASLLTELQEKLEPGGSVVVASSALPSGAATLAKQDTIIGHLDGVEGLLSTIDADTGALAAIDFATGADLAALATHAKQDTAQTALDAIKTAVETLDNAISGNEIQADVLTLPALAQLPAALAAGGGLKVEGVAGGVVVPVGATLKALLSASSAVTISPASLASDANLLAGRESTAIDNTSTQALDYLLAGFITVGTTPTTAKEIRIYVVGLLNDTTWPDVFDGTDSAETVTNAGIRDSVCKLAAVISTVATSDLAYPFGPVSVASLFGGVLPLKFSVFVTHNTAVNLNATGGNHVISITPVFQKLA